MKPPRVVHALDEVPDTLPAQPEGLHAGFAIALGTEEATKPWNAGNHFANARCGFRHRVLRQNVRRLPLLGREQQGRISGPDESVPAATSTANAKPPPFRSPGPVQSCQWPPLQVGDSAAVLQHIEQHLDFPSCPMPVDEFRHCFKTSGLPIGQEPPFDWLDSLGRIHFARHQESHPQRFTFRGGQCETLAPDLLVNFPCRLAVKRGQGELNLAQRHAGQHGIPQFAHVDY